MLNNKDCLVWEKKGLMIGVRFLFSAVAILMLCFAELALAQDMQLVWSDEFDGTELDLSKWSFQTGDGCPNLCGWGNNELEYYREENVSVSDGFLTISAKEEQFEGHDYTSSRIRTLNKGDWTYGRFEMKAKLPIGQGLWPAFWLLSSEAFYGTWAASGEIDIMELSGNEPAKVLGTIYYGGAFPQHASSSGEFRLPSANATFADAFHIFAVEWEPEEIRWYVDNTLYSTKNSWYSIGAPFPAPFDKDFHLLLNVAVGGFFPGAPDTTTVFPQTMVVDYVRVYQSPNAKPEITITAPLDGAMLSAGTDHTITAAASDSDGTISTVEFFQGGAKLGEVSQPPYEWTVQNIFAGCYNIISKATDNLGSSSSDTVSVTVDSCAQAPYLMTPAAIPGKVEAENFDIGGQGIAYNDADPTVNNGNVFGNNYRVDEGVDVLPTSDSDFGYHVSWLDINEWLEYLVDVKEGETYSVDVRISTETSGSLHLEFDGVTSNKTINFETTGGKREWRTIRTDGIVLSEGVKTMRVVVDNGGFNLNHISFEKSTGSTPELTVFDDFEDGDASDLIFFGGNSAAGSGQIADDQPVEGNYYFNMNWSGAGSNSFFYGGFFNNLDDRNQLTLPTDPWINLYVLNQSSSTVTSYTLEITVREDKDGNSWTDGLEDSRRLDVVFDSADFNDQWTLVSTPLTDFIDLNSGGNGIFDGNLDEVVVVISQVNGGNPSSVDVALDYIVFTAGEPLATAVDESIFSSAHPKTFYLGRAYPNPFNPTTSINYTLPQNTDVRLEVFNIVGQKVSTLVEKNQQAGRYTVKFDAEGLPSGVYFYRLQAGDFIQVRKMILTK